MITQALRFEKENPMEYAFLSLSLLVLGIIIGVSVLSGKPLQITIVHRTELPPEPQFVQTKEDLEDQKIHMGIAQAIQEAMGVFHDEDK